jgi:NTE family protein
VGAEELVITAGATSLAGAPGGGRPPIGAGSRLRHQPGLGPVLGVAAFGAFMAFLDATVVNVAFPSIRASFPTSSVDQLSWVLNAYNIVFAGLLVIFGRFADLLGRRRVFAAGLFVFTAMSAACAAANSVDLLIAFRVLQGVGAAMLVPSSLAIVVNAAPAERRSHAISLWGAAAALAAGLGPPVGGALVDAWNWRLTFLINVPLGILGWVLARRTIIESRAPGRRVLPDMWGALELSLALGAATLGIVQGGTWGWHSPATISTFVAAALLVALLVRSSSRHRSPVLDPRLLRIRSFTVGNLVIVAAGLGLYTYLLTHIFWLHYVWGYSLVKAGLAVAPGALVAAAVATPFGKLADRFGARAVVVPGALVWAGAYLWYATRVGIHPDFLGQWLPGQLISGVGVGATLPIASSGSLASVPAGRYATAAAVSSSSRQFGGVLGIAVLTLFIGHASATGLPGALRHGWELAGWSFAGAAVVGLFFGRVRPQAAGADDDGLHVPALSQLEEPTVEVAGPVEKVELLMVLPPEVREQILATGSEIRLPAGEALFGAGDPAEAMYLLRAGRLEVEVPGGAKGDIGPGAAVGELALLTGSPRSATVVARRDSDLVEISRPAYEAFVSERPQVVQAIASVLARQLQERSPVASPPAPPHVISVVALGAGVAADTVAEIAEIVYSGLQGGLTVEMLHDVSPEELGRAERSNDRVLLVAGNAGPWHDSCVRQSDRVLVVTSDPRPAPVAGLIAGAEVLVCGPAPDRDQIVGWHDLLDCRHVHHLGESREARLEVLRPVIDKLAGRSLALALAGGGARSLAHLGVLEVFEEAGVTVDRVSGSSMAAFIAAAHATGASAAEVDAMVFDEFVKGRPFSDYTLPLTSLARGRRGLAMLERCFGDLHFEELPRELVLASTDLYARSPVYHRRGLLREAISASICLPVLFPPRNVGGRVLVDGSLTDNCPTAPLSELDEGPVIAIRIGTGSSTPRSRTRPPTLGETLVRVMQMGGRPTGAGGTEQGATLTVTPDTRGIGLLEFHQIDEAKEAGRIAGRAALAALSESAWSARLQVPPPVAAS